MSRENWQLKPYTIFFYGLNELFRADYFAQTWIELLKWTTMTLRIIIRAGMKTLDSKIHFRADFHVELFLLNQINIEYNQNLVEVENSFEPVIRLNSIYSSKLFSSQKIPNKNFLTASENVKWNCFLWSFLRIFLIFQSNGGFYRGATESGLTK